MCMSFLIIVYSAAPNKMEYLHQFTDRIEQLYANPSLDTYTRFVNLMKVLYNMHEFYMKHYLQIMQSCKSKIEESEKMKEFLRHSYNLQYRIDMEYNILLTEVGYIKDVLDIKRLVISKITECTYFVEAKVEDGFRI